MGTYLSILRRRLVPLLLLTAVLFSLLFAGLSTGDATYRSAAVIEVRNGSVAENLLGQGGPYIEPERRIATEIELLRSPEVAEQTSQRLTRSGGLSLTPAEVAARTDASSRRSTNYIEVSGTGTDPAEALELTEAFVATYFDYRRKLQRQELEDLQDELRESLRTAEADLAQAPPDVADSPFSERAAALERIRSARELLEAVRLRLSLDAGGSQLLSAPALPSEPVGALSVPVVTAASLLGGFFLAAGLIFGLELLRDAVRTREEVQRLVGAPVLAEVPGGSAESFFDLTRPVGRASREAGRLLRLRLQSQTSGDLPGSVLVTGTSNEAADVLDVAVLLAAACASTGQRVLVVADGALDLVSSVYEGIEDAAGRTAFRSVWCLRATTDEKEGAGLFDHVAPGQALTELCEDHDVIIGAIAGSEGVQPEAAGPFFGAVLATCALNRTRGRRLRRFVEELESVGVHVDGAVITTSTRRTRRGGRWRLVARRSDVRDAQAGKHSSSSPIPIARGGDADRHSRSLKMPPSRSVGRQPQVTTGSGVDPGRPGEHTSSASESETLHSRDEEPVEVGGLGIRPETARAEATAKATEAGLRDPGSSGSNPPVESAGVWQGLPDSSGASPLGAVTTAHHQRSPTATGWPQLAELSGDLASAPGESTSGGPAANGSAAAPGDAFGPRSGERDDHEHGEQGVLLEEPALRGVADNQEGRHAEP